MLVAANAYPGNILSVPSGSVYWRESKQAYYLEFSKSVKGHPVERKRKMFQFSVKKYGTKQASENAAQAARISLATELGFLKTNYVSFAELNKQVPEEVKQYVSGFMDGDGSIMMGVSNTNQYSLVVRGFQSQDNGIPVILYLLRHFYGGLIYTSLKRRENQRTQHWYEIQGIKSQYILKDLSEYQLLKRNQALLAAEYLKLENPSVEVQQSYVDRLHAMKDLAAYQAVTFENRPISDAYIAGLFDAEGSIGLSKSAQTACFWTTIAQKSSLNLLQYIKTHLNNNVKTTINKNGDILNISTRSTTEFISRILPYSTQKKPQLLLAQEFYQKYKQTTEIIERPLQDEMETNQNSEKTVPDYINEFKRLKRI